MDAKTRESSLQLVFPHHSIESNKSILTNTNTNDEKYFLLINKTLYFSNFQRANNLGVNRIRLKLKGMGPGRQVLKQFSWYYMNKMLWLFLFNLNLTYY